jgi:hypothetical protein
MCTGVNITSANPGTSLNFTRGVELLSEPSNSLLLDGAGNIYSDIESYKGHTSFIKNGTGTLTIPRQGPAFFNDNEIVLNDGTLAVPRTPAWEPGGWSSTVEPLRLSMGLSPFRTPSISMAM